MTHHAVSKKEFETLSRFRYQLRRFLRFSEDLTHHEGVTNLQYLLLLHVKGFPGREWATVGELAEKLQAQPHGTVALVNRCEKLGLVRRQSGRKDRREVEIHLTTEGDKMVTRVARLHRDELLTMQGLFQVPGEREFLDDTPKT
jgi:DNA-binding MarR family transcriptional regulator